MRDRLGGGGEGLQAGGGARSGSGGEQGALPVRRLSFYHGVAWTGYEDYKGCD